MELSRRGAIAGAAVALAGCSGVQSEVDEQAEAVLGPDEHPFAGATTITVTDRSGGDHDVSALAATAAAYWNEHATEYAGFDVSFNIGDGSPDIELVFLDRRAELEGCQEHASAEVLGCSPLLRAEHRPERPVTIEVVAGGRPYGDVRITTKHELGHALGLGHDDDPGHIMSDSIEDRLPAYERRVDVLDTFGNAWAGRNEGAREYERAVERWNDERFAESVPAFEASAERYREATESVATAGELAAAFEGMDRPETVDREGLRESIRNAGEWAALAVERSSLMADAASARADGDVGTAREHRAEAQERDGRLRDAGFPAPIVVADALGLGRKGLRPGMDGPTEGE
ncbi:peptidase M10 family protein [Natronomonas moolapensis 8.8.11]|uniref:Peptidase M10 family protein n=1 Tax=Natronomonas moolapensis (strain DSM 18674 / CECT 7526 / JCM 14361 / 8.8.11) TaxID=268739 RepID=M1XZI5_NATM8|nr:hypothetical protein [Natronomonas moolapensis]CCQ35581.1 peptidase M10 family protein [Natronomonas moolapensis 8.8.11]